LAPVVAPAACTPAPASPQYRVGVGVGVGAGVGEAGAVCGAQCVPYLGLELNGMVNHSGSFDAHDINHHR